MIRWEATKSNAVFCRTYDKAMAMFDIMWEVAEDVCSRHQNWDCDYNNKGGDDGPELDEQVVAALHHHVSAAIKDGRIRDLIRKRDKYLAELPDQPCILCKPDEYDTGEPQQDYIAYPDCEICAGKGELPDWDRNVVIKERDFVDLAKFLAVCGGCSLHPARYRSTVLEDDPSKAIKARQRAHQRRAR